MPIAATNIAMGDVATELNIAISDVNLKTTLFAVSNTAGARTSGSFHNLDMGQSNNLLFSSAIYTPYVGTNQNLGNWAYYAHDAYIVLDFELINSSAADAVDVSIYLSQSSGGLGTLVYSTSVPAGNTDSQASFQTSVTGYSTAYSSWSGVYFIDMIASPNPGGTMRFMSASASDTDGVGAGTTRTTYTDTNGPWDFFSFGNFSKNLIAETSGVGIPWNKRTSFTVEFTD